MALSLRFDEACIYVWQDYTQQGIGMFNGHRGSD